MDNHVKCTQPIGFFLHRDGKHIRIKKAYSRFNIVIHFKMASLIVPSLYSSLNGSIFVIHDERKTIHLIVNLVTYSRKLISF